MSKDIALFRDYFKLAIPSKEQISDMKDSIVTTPSNDSRQALEVTFEATHSGTFNDNLRFYIPSRMMDGVKTFIKRRKPAKILKHHDRNSDPVGIITDAEYIPTIPEGLENNKDIQIMMDSSNSIAKQVAAAKRFMKTGIPFSDEWRGLGYIKLKGVLLDEKAIEQVNKGLFDAVSTSFRSPGKVFCSECQQNWAKDGLCEHEVGKLYGDEDEQVVCALVPGEHLYDECSLVVFDGDPLTQISIGHHDNLKNFSVPVEDWRNNSDENSSFVFSFRDYKEENTMADEAKEIILSDAEQEMLTAVKNLRPELDDEKAIEFAKELVNLKDANGKYPDQIEAELDDETALVYAIEDLEAADQEIDADAIYAEMEKEFDLMKDEGLLTEEQANDAKLSSEKRKNLSKSTFCGPERSFPVPDCAHVTAARRLIGRYKGPGNKSTILACVSRKAKALGCDSKSDTVEQEEKQIDKLEIPTCDMINTLDNDSARTLFNMMEAEMISRNLKLDRPCAKCAAHEDEAKIAKTALNDAETKINELENTLSVLRDELRHQMSDYMEQVDRFVELGAELTAAKKDHLALVGTLRGKFESVEKALDSLNDTNLKEQQAVIMEDFNVEDYLSKMNDGLANEPEGTIEDPVINADADNSQLPDGLTPSALALIEVIRKHVKDGNITTANQLYVKMTNLGVLDKKLVSFASLSADSKDSAE